jgi:hypothetical protein
VFFGDAEKEGIVQRKRRRKKITAKVLSFGREDRGK